MSGLDANIVVESLQISKMSDSDHSSNLTIIVEDITLRNINEETSSSVIKIVVWMSTLFISVVNIPIIGAVTRGKDYTFINLMVLFDCSHSNPFTIVLVS